MQINNVVIGGNLTRDPELKYTPSGAPVASFTIAINRKFKDASDTVKEEVSFILVDPDYHEDGGYQPIESTVHELERLGISVMSGDEDYDFFTYNPFSYLSKKYPDRLVRGWYKESKKWMHGNIHVQCDESETDEICQDPDSWFKPELDSDWEGFYEFITE